MPQHDSVCSYGAVDPREHDLSRNHVCTHDFEYTYVCMFIISIKKEAFF